MGKKEMRPIETNDDLTINLLELERQIEIDIEEGLTPFCLVANAGTTNTGAIDPMNELADLAFKHQMWLHADGAYGAAAVISEREKSKLSGLHRVDSLTLDPHKWWFQPFEIGCLLVRNGQHLSEMFGTTAPYLKDTESKNNKEINYYDRGLQLTRSFKAFKLYFSLKTFGLSTFQKAIEKGIDMAEYIQGILEKNQNWKVITPAQLGIITFRYEPQNCRAEELDQLALQMSQRLTEEGFAMVLTTRLFGKTVLRMCPIHPNVTKDDIRKTIEKLESYAIP
jgi:glutamate/tyrosine decarboxylase-like PLP-dependent enzyme